MRKLFIKFKDRLTSSYWFFPSTLFFLALVGALITLNLDFNHKKEIGNFLKNVFFLKELSLSTVRTYLGTLVGAVITVVGVVFSLTILTVSTASSQFGPRILNNFMRDRGNQVTLGVYTSTFVYASTILICLYEDPELAFVPYLSIFVSYLLALSCIGFLIYYIHHIPNSLRIESIVYKIATQTIDMIDKKFPEEEKLKNMDVLDSPKKVEEYKELESNLSFETYSNSVGYVQAIDLEGITSWAKDEDIQLCLNLRPGDFSNGRVVLARTSVELSNKQRQELNDFYAYGEGRTLPQNLMYLFSQLIEVAVRALSPGINDPITAMSCIDWMEAALMKMIDKDTKYSVIRDENSVARVLIRPLCTEEIFEHLNKGLSQYVATSYSTSMHWMSSLNRMHLAAKSSGQRKAIEHCARILYSSCRDTVSVQSELHKMHRAFQAFNVLGVEHKSGTTNPIQ